MKRTSLQTSPAMIPHLRAASLGSVSSGTLRPADLLSALSRELESQTLRNGAFLALPENFPLRDRCARLIGEAQDSFNEDATELTAEGEENASELIDSLCDCLSEFAPSFAYFGAHEGDGACFGFWASVEAAREECEFVSSKRQEWPDSDFRGEWLHVSDHGNATLYVREDSPASAEGYADREIWGIV